MNRQMKRVCGVSVLLLSLWLWAVNSAFAADCTQSSIQKFYPQTPRSYRQHLNLTPSRIAMCLAMSLPYIPHPIR